MKLFNTLQNQIFLLCITLNRINSLSITTPNQFTSWDSSSPLKVEWISSINDPQIFHIEIVHTQADSSLENFSSLNKKFILSNQESFNLYVTSNLKPSKDYQLHFISNTGETFAKSSTFEILPSPNPIPDPLTLNPKSPYPQNQTHQHSEPKQMVWQVLVSVSVSVGIGISLVSTVGGYTTMSYPGLLSEV